MNISNELRKENYSEPVVKALTVTVRNVIAQSVNLGDLEEIEETW